MHTTQHIEPEQRKVPLAPIPEWLQMSKEERATWLRHNHKGFLSKEEREEQLRIYYGDIEYVYLAEAEKARKTKDIDTFWQWISLTELPAHSLAAMKVWYGANFIRGTGFDTTEADEVYGPDWLEQ